MGSSRCRLLSFDDFQELSEEERKSTYEKYIALIKDKDAELEAKQAEIAALSESELKQQNGARSKLGPMVNGSSRVKGSSRRQRSPLGRGTRSQSAIQEVKPEWNNVFARKDTTSWSLELDDTAWRLQKLRARKKAPTPKRESSHLKPTAASEAKGILAGPDRLSRGAKSQLSGVGSRSMVDLGAPGERPSSFGSSSPRFLDFSPVSPGQQYFYGAYDSSKLSPWSTIRKSFNEPSQKFSEAPRFAPINQNMATIPPNRYG